MKLTTYEINLLLQACQEMRTHLEEEAADEPLPHASTYYSIEAEQYNQLIKKLQNESN